MNDHSDGMEPAIEPLPEQPGTGTWGNAAIAAGSAAILGPAGPGLSATVTAALALWADRLRTRESDQTGQMLGAAAQTAGLEPEEVVKRIIEDENLTLLMAEAIEAARRSRVEGKAAALGRSLGAILEDDALIDREAIWIRVLAVVEPPHIRVLQAYVQPRETPAGEDTEWTAKAPVRVSEVAHGLGLEEAVLPLVQDLIGVGLLMTPTLRHQPTVTPSAFDQILTVTKLGLELFQRLSAPTTE